MTTRYGLRWDRANRTGRAISFPSRAEREASASMRQPRDLEREAERHERVQRIRKRRRRSSS